MPKNVSGRVWKSAGQKASSKIKGNASKLGWEKRQGLRLKKDIVKSLEKEARQQTEQEKEVFPPQLIQIGTIKCINLPQIGTINCMNLPQN